MVEERNEAVMDRERFILLVPVVAFARGAGLVIGDAVSKPRISKARATS